MPRVNKRKARTDRYRIGVMVKDEKTKSGFRKDKSKPGENDSLLCEKGKEYYVWKFRFGGEHVSMSYPSRSQLTQSGFLSQMYDLIDSEVSGLEFDGIADQIGEIQTKLEDLRDECQESLDNMPEALQEGSESGQLLTARIESLDDSINNLESLSPDDWESELTEMKDDLDGNVNDLESERETAEEDGAYEALDDIDEQIKTAKEEYEGDVENYKETQVEEVKNSIEECE